ncbi:MAG: response regulator [Candidatus Omnitrophota bacterium]
MEKILVADDELEILGMIETILKKEGYEVVAAKDGQEALNLAKAQKPDLIVSDYLMPNLNGAELCRALKKESETKAIPIIIVTAYPAEKERSLSAGAVDFIAKPVDKFDLLLRIRSALRVRHISNELQKIIAYIAELEK